MKTTKLIVLALALLLALGLCACGESKTPETGDAPESTAAPGRTQEGPLDMAAVKAEIDSKKVEDFEQSVARPTDYVKLSIKDFGQIVVRLRPDVAPISVENFQKLVADGFYNGTVFHRVYPGFMIQGGAGEKELSPIKG